MEKRGKSGSPAESRGKRTAFHFFPVILLSAAVVLGSFEIQREGKSSLALPVDHPSGFWVEVESGGDPPWVRFFPAAPALSTLLPKADPGGEIFLANGDMVRLDPGRTNGYQLGRMPGSHLLLFAQKININRAAKTDLSAVPGIGLRLAEKIFAWRQQNGVFRDWSEVLKIRGIGEKSLSKFREYLTIYPDE